jgi:hypothetical protein
VKVGVVLLGFRDVPDSICEGERACEIVELERPFEVAGLVETPPAVELRQELFGFRSIHGRDPAAARHACLVC